MMISNHSGVVHAFDVIFGVGHIPGTGEKFDRVPNATPHVFEFEDGKMTRDYYIENKKSPGAANQNKPPKKSGNGGPV